MIWFLLSALTLVVVVALALPALKKRPLNQSRAEYDLQVYKDQLAELDRDVARGITTGEQADAARIEIQRRILALGQISKTQGTTSRAHGLAIASLVVVPLVGFGVYAMLGSPQLRDQPHAAREAEMRDQVGMIQNMVKSLAARLEKNPQDGPGWALLGRSMATMGLMEPAVEAYRKAEALMPGNTEVRMEHAGLILRSLPQGSPIPQEFIDLMRQILAVDPNSADALYFLGGASAEAGEYDKAREYWGRLLKEMEPGTEDYELVKRQMNELPK